ncbi:MAG TPA: hypothetical protein VIP57_05695, partial [Candidatus Dormibacteraeota bacterium]
PPTLFRPEAVNNVVARIKMVPEPDATGLLAEVYAQAKAVSPVGIVAPILQTMSLRPDFLAAIQAASRMHFSDGALTRAQHEMIASYVSALNRCRY